MRIQKKTCAILLIAGSGNRFGSDLPKQFHTIFGKSLYLYTLDRLCTKNLFHQIILVCSKDYFERVKKEVPLFVKVVVGGSTRQESSYKGLLACEKDTDIVLIHDGVRPFVDTKILEENISLAKSTGAVDTCICSQDTIVKSIDQKQINEIPTRVHYFRGQTPQTFSYQLILKAHEKAIEEGFVGTDDCSLVLRLKEPVAIAKGSERNIKITNKEDLLFAQSLLSLEKQHQMPAVSSVKNKTYLIVGGTGGIGRSLKTLMEKNGARVFALSRTSKPYSLDLNCRLSIVKTFKKIREEIGPTDGLINCAGLLKIKPFEKLTPEEIGSLLSVNLTGLIYCCKEVDLKKGAHIVNIASSSFSKGRKDYALYSSAKAAVVNFTEGLALERTNLFINVIVPDRTRTPMRSTYFPKESLKSLLEPEVVAKKIVDLLQTKTTGSVVFVRKATT